ncbi:MAG: PAS domain S-box protein, partial [Methanosarcinaceae archaeon]|nr:PAS domain S-box protein [Methanosarcinaceae archaeon]
AIEEMTGVTKEDILGKGDYTYAVPFYGERRPILIDLVLDFDRDFEKEYDFVKKIGNTLLVETFVPFVYGGKGAYLWAIASALLDSRGKLIGAIESIRDITERKRMEEALQEQKEFASNLIQYSATPTFVIDSQHKVVYWNLACEDLTGFKASELVGTDEHWKSVYDHKRPTLADMIINGEFDNYVALYSIFTPSRHVSKGLHAEDWFRNVGGKDKYLIFDAAPIYNREGELIAAVETIQDITERKKAEDELRDSKYLLQTVLDSIPAAVFWKDSDLIYLGGNRTWLKATGLKSLEEVIGKSDNDLPWEKEQTESFQENDRRVIESGIPEYNIIEAFRQTDGTYAWARTNKVPLLDKEGNVVGVLGTYEDITERKRAEEALKQSEERYRNVVELATDSIIVHSEEGRIIFVNPALVILVGAKGPEDLIGKSVLDIIPPERWDLTREHIQQVIDTRKPLKGLEEKVMRLDGSVIDVEVNGTFIIYGGEPAIMIVLHDITERKRAEEALKQSEERYRNVVEMATDSIVVNGEGGRIIFVNHAMVTLVGAKGPEDLIGKSVLDFIPSENRELTIKRIQHILDTHESLINVDEKVMRLDGSVIDAEVSGGFIIYGEKPAILTLLRDITERKLAEEALMESEEKYREMIEGLAEAVYRMTLPDGRYEYFSPAVKDVFGYSADDFINNPLLVRKIIHPDFIGYFEEKWADLIHGKVPPIYEYKIIDHEGHERWIIQSNKGIFNDEGNIIAIEGICRDITKRKLSEVEIHKYAEELKRSNELKDLFTDILHHDLLNPASIVKGYTEVLLDMEDNEQKLQSLLAIERNNERLIDLIERASKFAKLESIEKLDFKEMDIGYILKEVIENFRSSLEEKQMLIEFTADGSYLSKVSPVIEDVFANLLSNAIKYSPEKSRIIIDIIDEGEDWKVSVTDFGEGISDDDKPKLFERFKRVKKGAVKGTGLGLAIVKRLIALHGGTVGVEDNPAGQGSVFWVTVKKAL